MITIPVRCFRIKWQLDRIVARNIILKNVAILQFSSAHGSGFLGILLVKLFYTR